MVYWLALSVASAPAGAQIVPDETLPSNSRVVPGCVNCVIEGGTVRGNALFHSFREFSVPTGGSAWFNNVTQIQSIFTRVTGASISTIDGLLKTNGTANLFFLNPNGIVFGPNARLQIGGSFFASTGNSFRFSDGSEFSAKNPQAPPLLTINVPIGLQYGPSAAGATIANRGNLATGEDLTLVGDRLDLQGQLQAGRDLTLQAQDTVQIRDTLTTPFLAQAGANLTIEGDRGLDILALSHANHTAFVSGGNLRLISDGIISGDAHFANGGSFQIRSKSGQPARFVSLYDPIISSVGDVEILGDYDGAALLVESLGNIRFSGSINITGPDTTFNPLDPDPDLATLASSNALIVRAGRTSLAYAPTTLPITFNNGTAQPGSNLPSGLAIAGTVFTNGGPIILEANRGDITTVSLITFLFPAGAGGAINLSALNGNITTNGDALSFGFDGNGNTVQYTTQNGNIAISGEVNSFSLNVGNGGAVNLSTANGNLSVGKVNTFSLGGASAGTVQLTAGDRNNSPTLGNITIDEINTFAVQGVGGNIGITSTNGDIQVGSIIANSYSGNGSRAGNIAIATSNGNIFLNPEGTVQAWATTGNGGQITVSTEQGNITTGQLFAYSNTANGGSVSVSNINGNIQAGGILTYADSNGQGGKAQVSSQNGNITTSFIVTRSNDGQAGDIAVTTGKGSLSLNGLIAFSVTGRGGNIDLQATDAIDTNALNTTGSLGSGNITAVTTGDFISRIREIDLMMAPLSAVIASDTFGSGRGGDIRILARSVLLADGAQLSASTHSSGSGGNLVIQATERVELSGVVPPGVSPGLIPNPDDDLVNPGGLAGIPKGAYLGGYIPKGNVQDLSQASNNIFPTGIFTQTTAGSTGNAGSIVITAPQVVVQAGAAIAATTFGQGNAGNVSISTLGGNVNLQNSSILSGVATGSAGGSGTIDIQTASLSLTGNSLIQTQTLGQGNAGTIQIMATNSVNLAGAESAIRSGSGDAQNQGTNFGSGGNLRINSPTVNISDRATLSAQTFTANRGGNIVVTTNQFNLASGGQLQTTTFGSGQVGDITVTGLQQFSLSDPGTGLFANTAAGSTGAGGSIFVAAPHVLLQQQAKIAVDSLGSGQGGNITVQANQVHLRDRASLTAETASSQGGNITIDSRDLLMLRRNSLISASAGTAQGQGDGGNITIRVPNGFVIGVLSENSDIRANAFTGNGGKINISTFGIFGLRFRPQDTPFSDITASSQFGFSGTVTLNTLNTDPSRGLVALSSNFVDSSNRISAGCSSDGAGSASPRKTSRFVITGRGGLPDKPEDLFVGDRTLIDPIDPLLSPSQAIAPNPPFSHSPASPTSPLSHSPASPTSHSPASPLSHSPSPTSQIIEAQGWIIAADGTVHLIENPTTAAPQPSWQAPWNCSERTTP
jgi:filamentous hemagglutinin family protein